MDSDQLLKTFLSKFATDEDVRVNNTDMEIEEDVKSIKITEGKEAEDTSVNSITKLGEDDKPYALKAFGATLGSYHYKRNIKKAKKEEDGKPKKEFVVIEKLSDIK